MDFFFFLTGSYLEERQKRKVFNFHFLGPCRFFVEKSDVFEMRKNKKFHILGPCQHEGPIW